MMQIFCRDSVFSGKDGVAGFRVANAVSVHNTEDDWFFHK
jgi:hypothetical protein